MIKGKKVARGSYLGLYDGQLCSAGEELTPTTLDLIARMLDEDDELVTILYGKEITRDEAEEFAAAVEKTYPDVEVELKYGGQPIYYYILAIE